MNGKHIIAICALALCTVLCMVGASALSRSENETSGGKGPDWVTVPKPIETITPIVRVDNGIEAQYLRTNGYREGVKYPIVKIIRSVEELNKYYEANRGRYDMGAFPAACQKYDETYFKDRILLIVVTEAGSGSIRYQVTGAALTGDVLTVDIDVQDPGVGTCDMAEWHILIEPAAGVDVADEAHVSVKLHAAGEKNGPNSDGFRTVTYKGEGTTFSLRLPESWQWIEEEGDTWADYAFAVRIGPGDGDYPVVIGYETKPAFGVCGTGLEQKPIRLGNYEGWQGTYDGRPVWDFITLGEMGTGRWIILNDGFDKAWWDRYGDETMEILATLEASDVAPDGTVGK